MHDVHRRSVLAAGAALSTGIGLASSGVGASDVDGDLPDPSLVPNPEMDEDWASHRGDAGHARFIEDGYEFDGDSLEVAWSVDQTGSIEIGDDNVYTTAVADDTVYTTTTDGVIALDAADGSLLWENTDIDAHSPAVVGETVYLNGGEIVALNRDDGSVRWESTLGAEEWTGNHTVAYDSVFAVVDGTLYALEADDGSVRWQKDTAVVESSEGDEQESGFITGTAAANGVVYAGTEDGTLAFDHTTGETVWQNWRGYYSYNSGHDIYATEKAVLAELSGEENPLYDAQTGELLNHVSSRSGRALSNESAIGGDDNGYGSYSVHGDEYDWSIDVTYTYGEAVFSGETVYVYFEVDGHNYGDRDYDQKLVALDKRDGSEKWTLSKDDAPVGHIRAISGKTIYVEHEEELFALREQTDDEDDSADEGDGTDDEQDDADDGDNTDDTGDEETSDEDEESGDGDSCEVPGDENDDGENTTGSDDDDENATDSDDGDDGATESEERTYQTDADESPGFTTGAGIFSGLLGLEWLRRQSNTDEPDE
ncbi:PQQ-binding-like beta-propeller repeat protein [Natronosalvus rutilus]|uniref:PQQ-binding-like beta-propeller repeat protein n=1 Tax=Natronosalvus rutilus TaxID=2953753 RepID=A0A9E7N5G8_9EURY|nr:PQQ-binding-like beta-propeller repeat protein [Natronosalvus rutilus]UTF52094.1 PQQ-binding-like beta-propeller repeat protein [Natronosalvus rutilus]